MICLTHRVGFSAMLGSAMDRPAPPATGQLPADCARSYRAIRRLGGGGYGAVFEAQHIALDRPAAVKVLHGANVADAEQIARFLQEAKLTAALVHPNIVRVLDHGAEAGVRWTSSRAAARSGAARRRFAAQRRSLSGRTRRRRTSASVR